ncbi:MULTISPECIES: SDR family NAD(P)-dependent oxidoreductase [unclassified Peribacillus]|uniref:SDR family NAD(P)-dependent oxidoreductase n=1 Tax=unclassified Peribacillus TaxID=2675266 RepID=UPI001F4D9907|nr:MULTISPECIES: glucose 1-dehydrogenase [unclassified Peribacillus]MCK1986022.1 glucose 1-dehydrogenase [Peribacillus sp. Aquil_B1]MCK2011245.1 glucose 1-dehydrogenase [Peribacillus sp. Aquil_B8]
MKGLNNRKAIVTGAAQGLGLAIAEGLCEYGVKVCILDISPNLNQVVEELRQKGYQVEGLHVDLSQQNQILDVFNKAIERLDGELDILVNNAGIHKPMPAVDLLVEDFQRVMDVNVTSVFQLCKLSGQIMKKKGKGKIINIASVLATQGGFNASAYSTSKGAVAQLTKSLSNEWAKEGINVNAIAPGYYNTELNKFILEDEERLASLVSRIPAGRFGNPEELAGTVQFLASSKSDYINGVIIPVDGGFLGR